MTVTTSSYVRHRSGHCMMRDSSTEREPCWGEVKIVDTVDEDEDGRGGIHLLACKGHFAKIRDGYRAKYRPEPQSDTTAP